MSTKVLVTGGCGYIGSHTCVALIERGFEPIIIDNLCNSHPAVLDRIAAITGHRPNFYRQDIRDEAAVKTIFAEHEISAVIHFAALKAVTESVERPLKYYLNNVGGSLSLLEAMNRAGVKRLIFSSTAAVYGVPEAVPISESAPIRPTNPYGETKATIERILRNTCDADSTWRVGVLRYFNAVGAHESGLIGEDPQGTPNNLMPYVSQVAVGQREYVEVFGDDYSTPDGTGIRDYVHVMDLVEAHVAALDHLFRAEGSFTVNIGTGKGYSVIEVIKTFEKACSRSIPYQVVGRRPGDIATCWADAGRAQALLKWRTRRNLEQICADVWRWQTNIGYSLNR